ncbi:hypothetical protein BGZ93_005277 [Podila epicladia]|nr:hypothetical protein BGZ93_005277 [Podila epicladia]
MEHTHSQPAPSSTTQLSTDIGDDFGDLDDAFLSQILDDDDAFDPATTSNTSGNQSGEGQHSATSTTPVDTSSSGSSNAQLEAKDSDLLSSGDEDLAALEELNRKRAQLEAKLKAKRQKKVAASTPTPGTKVPSRQSSPPRPPSSSKQDSPPPPQVPSSKQDTSIVATTSKASPERDFLASSSQIVDSTTTPTRSPRSPMIRTPSPPSRSRFLMSPPSGAYSRKRHHSPSPLPRRDSFSAPRPNLASTPTSGVASRGIKHNMEAYRTRLSFDKPLTPSGGRTPSTETNGDDQLDDIFLDQVLDDLDPEGPSDAYLLLQDESRKSQPLIAHFEEKGKRRAAEQARVDLPKSTFKTVAAQVPVMSDEVAIEHGHTMSYDPLTKLRIEERYQSLGAVFQMTYGQTVLPIKNTEQIQSALLRPSNTGALLITSSFSTRPGLLDDPADSNRKSSTETASKSWILAGVVGAKSKIRTTAKKARYCHFQLSDLNNSAINVFLFRKVLEAHYGNIEVGDVVVIMNPKLLNQTEKAGVLGVEVDDPGCLFTLGRSKDFGLCQAVKLNNEDCGRILDSRASMYCQHHIMMATNKHRNQRGSLIAGTSSIYDLNKQPSSQTHTRPMALPRRAGASNKASNKATSLISSRETTYIFDDGGIGTSSLADPEGKKKDSLTGGDGLSSFLMNQNNPGGQYLRQAKVSKETVWAKDITSPKTPTKITDSFPAEMIRRMGYDPVSGQFVPGSPKRGAEDPEARERSIRLLAERVKSPPAPIALMSTMVPGVRKRKLDSDANGSRGGQVVQGDVFFDRGSGQGSRTGQTPMTPPSAKKKWVDLNLDSSSDDDDGNGPLLSLTAARERNLMEARKNASSGGVSATRSNLMSPPRAQAQRKLQPSSSMSMLLNRTSTSTPSLGGKATTSNVPSNPTTSSSREPASNPAPSSSSFSSSTLPSSATGTDTRPKPSGQPAPKKGKFNGHALNLNATMSSRRKKLSTAINIPVSATVDDVVSALLSLALPNGDMLASVSEHVSPHAPVDSPETMTATFTTITATTTETEEMPSVTHQQHIAINHKDIADTLENLLIPDSKSSTLSFLDILQKSDWTQHQTPPKENATAIQRLDISQPSTRPPISLSTLMKQAFGATLDIPHRTITPLETFAAWGTVMSEKEDLLSQEPLEYCDSFFSDPNPDPIFEDINTRAAAMSLEPDLPQEPRTNVQEPDQGYGHGLTHGGGANVDNTTLVMAVHPVPLTLRERPRESVTFDTTLAAFQNPSKHEEDAYRATIEESTSQSADRSVRYNTWNDESRSTLTGQETNVPKPVANTGLGLESGSSNCTNIDQSLRHLFESRSFRRLEQTKRSVPDITEEYWREPLRRLHATTDFSSDTTQNHPLLDREELKRCLQEEDYTQVTPLTFIHTDRYLEPITKNNPLVTIRLVFLSSQLPRSVAFTKMMLPLRNKHLIDTFLIPHETQPTHPDADVVLGFSGALTRVLLGLKEFLQEMAPKPRRFYMWRLCVLIPHRIHFLFIGEQDHSLVYDEENDMAESSIPQLRKCLGRRYGPVSEDAPDEHILTLESCTLDRIMDALRFVAETMVRDEECYGPADDGMYLGGRPSAIPAAIMQHSDHLRGAQAKMHVGLPVGYLVRPEMARCQRRMQLRPYHLQLLLTLVQASYVIGRHGHRIFQLQESTGAILELSRNAKSSVRVCDLGGHELETLVGAVGTVVESMYRSAVAEWEVEVYVPQRVAAALDSDETRMALMAKDVEVDILALEEAEQRIREQVVRLEESEVECVVRFMSANEQAGIEHAVRTTLEIMYRNAEE